MRFKLRGSAVVQVSKKGSSLVPSEFRIIVLKLEISFNIRVTDISFLGYLWFVSFGNAQFSPLYILFFIISIKILVKIFFSSVQSLSRVQLFAIPWTAAHQASLSITNSWSPPKPMSIESVMPSNHLILCHPLLLLPQSFPASGSFQMGQLFASGSQSFSFNISPSNEHPGLISFRMDWLDLPAVQGTLKNLLQYHSSKASILRHSAFFIVQLSHPSIHDYWKNHSLD